MFIDSNKYLQARGASNLRNRSENIQKINSSVPNNNTISLKNYRAHGSTTSSAMKMRKNLSYKGKFIRETNKVKNDSVIQAAKQLVHQVSQNLDNKECINLFREYLNNQAISSTDPAGLALYID